MVPDFGAGIDFHIDSGTYSPLYLDKNISDLVLPACCLEEKRQDESLREIKELNMTKRMLLLLFAFDFLVHPISDFHAQSEAALNYLLIAPGGRAVGMGETYAAISDDALGLYYNPAGIAQVQDLSLHVTRSRWIPWLDDDLYFTYFAVVKNIRGLGVVGLSYNRMSYGECFTCGSHGEIVEVSDAYDCAFALSGAHTFSNTLSMGIAAKIMRSRLPPEDETVMAADFGLQVRNLLPNLTVTGYDFFPPGVRDAIRSKSRRGLSFGFSISNMGPDITYDDYNDASDPLPQNLRVGAAYYFLDTDALGILLAYDFEKLLVKRDDEHSDPFYKALFTSWSEKTTTHHFGMECSLFHIVSLRYGFFNHEYEYEFVGQEVLAHNRTFTWGIGIGIEKARFDFGQYSTGSWGNVIKGGITIVL